MALAMLSVGIGAVAIVLWRKYNNRIYKFMTKHGYGSPSELIADEAGKWLQGGIGNGKPIR